MSLYDFFKNIFGVTSSTSDPSKGNEFKKPVWIDEYVEEDDDILSQQQSAPTFPVLSNPLEIHRYFEQQMEYMVQMMRNFSGLSHPSIFDEKQPGLFGAVEPPDRGSRNLRDEYLKKPDATSPSLQKDMDLDHKVKIEGLGGIMEENDQEERIVAAVPTPKFHFFGESVITRTVRKPDGTVETRSTKRRSDGTKETVVSVQKADDVPSDLFAGAGISIFSERTDDQFFTDLFDNFFRRN